MEKARKYRIIGVVLLVIGFITIGFIMVDFFARKEVVDKIIDELSWEDIWNGVDDTLRTEMLTPTFYSFMIFSVPFIGVALIFITLSEKLKEKYNK